MVTTVRSQKERILSRDAVEALIANGRQIVIVDGVVIKTDAWLPFHPGGDKAVLHMIGKDATDEVRAFHSVETQAFMQKYAIGRIEGRWRDFVPPIQGGVFRTQQQIETDSNAASSVDDTDNGSSASSGQASPIFDADSLTEGRTRRRHPHSNSITRDSSATSLSSLDIDLRPAQDSSKQDQNDIIASEIERDLEVYPSLDPETQRDIVEKYRLLDHRIREQGLYDCNYRAYALETVRYVSFAALSAYFLHAGWYFLSAVFLGILWHQLVFTVHDAGHMGITHNFHVDSCIGIFIANYLGGLSCCWWKRNHNVHHIVTNSAEHDPDIQHMPFFAISTRFFDSLRSTYHDRIMEYDAFAKFVLRYQHWLYYPILTFGRFNLYALSWQYIFLGQGPRKGPARWHRYLEMAGQVFFWYWFGYLLLYKSLPNGWTRFMYLMVSHAVTMPVHVQITLSHFAMSTADLGVAESFPQRQLRTTMDVDCPEWLDFIHGGLQFQAIHHLFPRIPRHNLRRCQRLVKDFCKEVDIPYAVYGFTEGNQKVIGQLGEVAKQARILAECQRSISVSEVLHGH